MKKSILIGVMCVLMMVVLTVLGIFDFPYKRLIFSLVSIIMFVGFGYLLRIMNPLSLIHI